MAPSPSLLFLLTALLVLCNLTPSIATSTSHSTSPPLPLPSQPSDELPPASPPSRVEDFVVDPQFIPFDFGSFNSRLSFPAHGGNDVAASDGGNDVDSFFGDFGTSYSPLSFPAHENDVASPSTITFTEPTGITAGKRFSSSDVLALLLTYGFGAVTVVLIVLLIWALCKCNGIPEGVLSAAGNVMGATLVSLAFQAVGNTVYGYLRDVASWVIDSCSTAVVSVTTVAGSGSTAAVSGSEGAANNAVEGGIIRRYAEKAAQVIFGFVGGLFALGRTTGTNTQPLLEPELDLEAGEEIEPAQGEGIEPAHGEENQENEPVHGEENQEIEPAHDAAGGEQNQPLLVARSRL